MGAETKDLRQQAIDSATSKIAEAAQKKAAENRKSAAAAEERMRWTRFIDDTIRQFRQDFSIIFNQGTLEWHIFCKVSKTSTVELGYIKLCVVSGTYSPSDEIRNVAYCNWAMKFIAKKRNALDEQVGYAETEEDFNKELVKFMARFY
jgi:hypothetical protein